jgi:hypothetical protein
LDIISVATLSMFGAAAVGGVVGFLVGRFTQFEIGLMVGLAIFGGVTLYFAGRCFLDYREFANAGSNAVWGEVVEIVDKPSNESGSITSPAPIIRFTAADGVTHTIEGPTAGSAKVGEHVTVLVDAERPERSRIGQVHELRGGAIAFMLFGTFPISFNVVLLAGLIDARRAAHAPPKRGTSRRSASGSAASTAKSTGARKGTAVPAFSRWTMLFMAAMVASISWIALPGENLLLRFSQGFGGITAALVAYALVGARIGLTWVVGLLMLALNFGVWSFALHLLS